WTPAGRVPGTARSGICRRAAADHDRQDHAPRAPRPLTSDLEVTPLAELDPRQKAERIAALFRDRREIDILPTELMPADLGEAYAIRAAFEAIETARGRGSVAGYKIGLTTPIMQKLCGVAEPCY